MKNARSIGIAIAGGLALLLAAFWAVDRNAERRGAAKVEAAALDSIREYFADSLERLQVQADSLLAAKRADERRAATSDAAARRAARVADSLRAQIAVTSPTTIVVKEVEYVVPPEVPARFAADSLALEQERAAHADTRLLLAGETALRVNAEAQVGALKRQVEATDRRVATAELLGFTRGRGRGRLEGAGAVLSAVSAVVALVSAVSK